MSFAKGPVNRPILTAMIYLIVIIVGAVSFFRLSIDLMPDITFPTISISTSYGNVGPEEMEELVTRPLEESVAAVQGVDQLTSTSTEGNSTVRVSFTWGYNLEEAANDIRERIDRAMRQLPDDIDDRPMIRKFDLSAFPVVILGVASNLNPLDLRQIVDDQVKYRIERVDGVAAVDIRGGLAREIHVDLDAEKIKALGLSTTTILAMLQNENQNIPAGTYKTGNFEVLIRTQGEFASLDEIRNTVIAVRNGAPIRISDFATVSDSWQEVTRLVRVDGVPSLRLSINKQSGANTVQVADAVKAEVERINRDIPQIKIIPLIDTSTYVRNSINNVGNSTLLGGLLAVLILFLFLRNVSSTLIIATAIPVSIIATFGLIYFGGFTLNLMTFGGLALGIGMLVDNSIVVLENIYRLREGGMSPRDAALNGTSEVGSAIFSSTATTLVVFLPVVFMRGMSGIYFQQLAYVVAFSLSCSLVVALTLVPMLSSRFLNYRSDSHAGSGRFFGKIYDASERTFKAVEAQYSLLLAWALDHKRIIILSALGIFIVSIILIRFIGVDFMPSTDQGEVRVSIEMAVGTRLEVLDELVRRVEMIVGNEVPEIKSTLTTVGGGGWRNAGGHTAEIRMTLVPLAERNRSSEQIADALRPILNRLPGATIRTRPGQGLFLLRMMSGGEGESVTVEVRGHDLETSRELANRVNDAIKGIEGITDTQISREEGRPEQVIRIDRAKAADLGLNVATIGQALQTAIGGSYASYYRDAGKEYRILVRLSEEDRQNLRNLLDLTVTNNRGQQVVLRNVVEAVPREGPVRIERKDQERTVYVTCNYSGRPMGDVINDVRAKLHEIPVPKDFSVIIGGDYEEQQKAFRELLLGLILSIILIYMVMAGQFESFKNPLVVLFSVPMAVIGVTLTMILSGTSFSLNAYIGCIMLGGIIVNNAILLVDYTNLLRGRDNMPLYDAIRTAGSRRLRPILMTTLTTVLGLMPLSFGFGEGGETQAPLARVVIGGLISSALITLVLIPVVYAVFERRSEARKLAKETSL